MIGDELITDIMFGNINNMATCWVTQYRELYSPLKHFFEEGEKMENEHADRTEAKTTIDHKGFKVNL